MTLLHGSARPARARRGPGCGRRSRLAAAHRHAARSQAAAEQAITSSINAFRRAADAHDIPAAAYERLAAAGGDDAGACASIRACWAAPRRSTAGEGEPSRWRGLRWRQRPMLSSPRALCSLVEHLADVAGLLCDPCDGMEIGSWFEQACGRERPAIDLPDDLLLAGVVLHDVLPGCVGLGRGMALGGSVAVALVGVAPQPVAEDPV